MIQIKNPCDANWQEMTPAQSGKYCGACEKVVVDFSNMNDVQIKEYFTQYATQKTCGRFLNSQLERPLVATPVTRFNKFLTKLNQLPVTRTVLLFLTSTSMWISGCEKNNNEDGMTTGDSVAVTENHSTQLPGDSSSTTDQRDNLLIKQDPNQMITGEATSPQTIKMLPPQVLMGDVCVSPPDKPDTAALTIADPDSTHIIHVTTGAVMMVDTVSQKIKRKKK